MAMDWMNLGKEPISGDNPAGIDMRYEPEFEVLQAEIDKMSSPTAASQVDWHLIVKKATVILAEKSKDLTVASYLAVGLIRTEQVDGLDSGIQVLRDMLEAYWDKLYPAKKRMRGRVGALTWWIEKTENEFQNISSKPLKADQIERMLDNLKRIDEILVEKMPEPPLLRPIQRIVESLPVEKTPEEKVEPQAPAQKAADAPADQKTQASKPDAAKAAPAKTEAPVQQGPESIENEKDARKAVDAALRTLRQASYILLKSDFKNPSAYRIRRLSSWVKVQALPPHTDGKTQIPPPPPQTLESLTQLRDDGNLEALIENVEQKVTQFVFWYDLHRLVAEALKDLGADYQAALETVCNETGAFFKRLPGSETLSFADGTPFADPETRKWLQRIKGIEGGASAGSLSDSGAGGDGNELVASVLQKAKALARKKQLTEAVGMLQEQMHQTPSRHRQMQWRLGIAGVLLAVKKTQLALPHLEQILSDIDTFNLEQWDPQLALEGLTAAWQAFSSLTTDDFKKRATVLLARIAGLDPVEALRLSK